MWYLCTPRRDPSTKHGKDREAEARMPSEVKGSFWGFFFFFCLFCAFFFICLALCYLFLLIFLSKAERQISHAIPLPNIHSSQSWLKLKPAGWNPTQAFHLSGRDSSTWADIWCLLGHALAGNWIGSRGRVGLKAGTKVSDTAIWRCTLNTAPNTCPKKCFQGISSLYAQIMNLYSCIYIQKYLFSPKFHF